jgi:hypothetical protein
MGRIGCLRWEKSQCDFVAWAFALIALVHPILRRVSSGYKTISNAPKHYATHQNMSLGPNGVDSVRSLQKIPTWLRGTYFCINCTRSHCFALSFMQLRNDPKCSQTLCSAPKHEFRVQCGGLGAFFVKKFWRDFVARTFALVAPVHTILHRVLRSYEQGFPYR